VVSKTITGIEVFVASAKVSDIMGILATFDPTVPAPFKPARAARRKHERIT